MITRLVINFKALYRIRRFITENYIIIIINLFVHTLALTLPKRKRSNVSNKVKCKDCSLSLYCKMYRRLNVACRESLLDETDYVAGYHSLCRMKYKY